MLDPQQLLNVLQLGGLAQRIEAGDNRTEEIQQQQPNVLVAEELPMPRLVPLGADFAKFFSNSGMSLKYWQPCKSDA